MKWEEERVLFNVDLLLFAVNSASESHAEMKTSQLKWDVGSAGLKNKR